MDGLGLEIAFDNFSARLVVIELFLFCLVISVLRISSSFEKWSHMVSKNARCRALRRRRGDRRGARANGSELLARTSEGRARIVRTTAARIGP